MRAHQVMRYLISILAIVATLSLGCTPSEQAPGAPEPTPTAAAGEEITGMDFESGKADRNATPPEEPAAEPTPDGP
jgi:hypothetical protein